MITQTCTADDFIKVMEAQKTRLIYGWYCPKCGRGNSPFSLVCPCGPNIEVTTASSTGELPLHFWPNENKQ